jgi:hypothetical protein
VIYLIFIHIIRKVVQPAAFKFPCDVLLVCSGQRRNVTCLRDWTARLKVTLTT